MSDVLRGGLNNFGVPSTNGDIKLQLKRPKAKNTQSIPELVAKFGELKRKILELTQENQSIKEQLIKAHETNSLLSQENTKLKEKHSEVLDVENTIDESIEELLSAADDVLKVAEEKPVYISKIPRPVRFSVAAKAPEIIDDAKKEVKVVEEVKKVVPTMKTEVKLKYSSAVQASTVKTEITDEKVDTSTQKESPVEEVLSKSVSKDISSEAVLSPFEVVDLTLVKKDALPTKPQTSTPQTSISSATKPVTSVVSSISTKDKPISATSQQSSLRQSVLTANRMDVFAPKNILEENGAVVEATIRKEKSVSTKSKLEAVDDSVIEDIRKYLLVTDNLALSDKKTAIVNFINLDIIPKQVQKAVVEQVKEPADEIGVAVMKLAHLSEAEKARLYADLNMSVDDFYLKSLTTLGVTYL
jgi:hypothetical protein